MKFLTLSILIATIHLTAFAQSNNPFEQNKRFTGAEASRSEYKAIYQLDQNDPKIIEKTFRNIKNVLEDPRLKGKLQIELIAFSGGTDAYLRSGKYEKQLRELVEKGVIVAQCENTLKERKIAKEELFDFIALVPTGNGELILRAAEGWAIVKP